MTCHFVYDIYCTGGPIKNGAMILQHKRKYNNILFQCPIMKPTFSAVIVS